MLTSNLFNPQQQLSLFPLDRVDYMDQTKSECSIIDHIYIYTINI